MNLIIKSIFLFSLLSCAWTSPKKTSYFEDCYHHETGGLSIPFRGPYDSHEFRSECAPDTLYVWLEEKKIDWSMYPKNPLRKGVYLYTWRTPLATYAYGKVQIRLKLKPHLKFKWLLKGREREHLFCPQVDQDSTVYVLTTTYSKTVSEYLICSKEVIESWSTGTPHAYQEAKREFEYINSVKNEEPLRYDAFGFLFGRKKWKGNDQFSSDSFFINWDFREITWSDEKIKTTIELMQKIKTPFRGHVFGNKEGHFNSQLRLYY